jgi:hypothetical protein
MFCETGVVIQRKEQVNTASRKRRDLSKALCRTRNTPFVCVCVCVCACVRACVHMRECVSVCLFKASACELCACARSHTVSAAARLGIRAAASPEGVRGFMVGTRCGPDDIDVEPSPKLNARRGAAAPLPAPAAAAVAPSAGLPCAESESITGDRYELVWESALSDVSMRHVRAKFGLYLLVWYWLERVVSVSGRCRAGCKQEYM